MGLTKAVQEATGVSIDHIFLVMREMPGFNFVDAGEHVPDYVPAPDDRDLAGHKFVRVNRAGLDHQPVRRRDMPFIQCDLEEGLSDAEKGARPQDD